MNYLFNKAGIAIGGEARHLTLDHWRRVMEMMQAARTAEVILDGVARNQALIVFPASIRWARRAYNLFPRLIHRELLRQFCNDRRSTRQPRPWPGEQALPQGDKFRGGGCADLAESSWHQP